MNDNLKETSTLGLAALFMAKGAKLVGTDKSDPRKMVFKFNRQKPAEFTSVVLQEAAKAVAPVELPLDDWELAWVNRSEILVDAITFFDALRDLKTAIHTK